MTNSAPDNPVGPPPEPGPFSNAAKADLIAALAAAAPSLHEAIDGLSDKQLDTRYKNWTIRQIVHHVADSHVHSYLRFKWAMTEDNPTIKAYEEADWVRLGDSSIGAVAPPLAMLHSVHACWLQLLETMTEHDFGRTFVHPQTGQTVVLWNALHYYPWHARHHTGQIVWLRGQRGW
ncbi:putative metal-dependent hydrolase YfiT [Posidoniimonas polymericola]|uniref:Putative metal-dependent hydrolase YfiT n=1 Tax=Posidoniimonas polymericola TaxID=2528002 RepID=A0A5C5ZEC2_9BACT|nr:putative metal-dependent hydrolase [Posidoniimonas polymericola]TWT85779.1 putative metal-dependent hydrolase YfiT [Posidoniimonas polymericola]